MPENKANKIAAQLRSLSGSQKPNLFDSAASELERLSAFELAFFSMMEIVKCYAKANGELDFKARSKDA